MNKNHLFASILKEKRLSCGMSQIQVAKKCYLAKSSYNHFESGRRIPSLETFIRICYIFNTNPLEFLCAIIPDDIKEENPEFTNFLNRSKRFNADIDVCLFEIFNKLHWEEQKVITDIMDTLASNRSIIPPHPHSFP